MARPRRVIGSDLYSMLISRKWSCKVSISRHGGDNFVSSMHDKQGQYTAISAYHLAMTASFFFEWATAGRGTGSEQAMEEKLWMSVWGSEQDEDRTVVYDPWLPIHWASTSNSPYLWMINVCFANKWKELSTCFYSSPMRGHHGMLLKKTTVSAYVKKTFVSFKYLCSDFL
jgi:hypothetical protein